MNPTDQNLTIERYAFGRESGLVEKYIQDGPTHLQESMNLSDEEWLVIFDYLVFEHNLLQKCVTANCDFFVDLYIKHGMAHLREIFDVDDEKYDRIWSLTFDYLAICSEGLRLHVTLHRQKYVKALRERGSDFVRKVIGIAQPKYEEHWRETLDFLLHAVCDDIFSENTYDHGLRAFAQIINAGRVQRRINEQGLI
ncbi:hypothetical protein HY604_03060 [Candidatus Peregrinibacteria bacterium]|nr:hypothetical protein [Candidatus Peregrinibacteria bacterium]